jgi:hypothetical protein
MVVEAPSTLVQGDPRCDRDGEHKEGNANHDSTLPPDGAAKQCHSVRLMERFSNTIVA